MPEQPTTDPSPTTPDMTPATAESTPATPESTSVTPAATETTPATPASPVPPAAAPEAPATTGSTSKRKKILSAIGTVAVVLLAKFGLGYMLSDKPAADTLSIGQCVQRGDDDSISAVDCGDKGADFKVVFIKKGTLESSADQTCSAYEATTMTFFESEKGETIGNTICLGAVR